jgi:hypothetical protein
MSCKNAFLHIQIPEAPLLGDCNRQNNLYGCHFHHWAESVFIINFILLLESLGNKLGLVPINCPTCLLLHLVNLFTIYNILWLTCWNEVPGFVPHQGCKFIIHGFLPTNIIQRFMQSLWFTNCTQNLRSYRIVP